ncbi:hypothetical protein AB1I68_00645 [Paenibacillus pabuli]|uniref:hypothetical protein n=1 Tax=Paenibacillus pabuli TaxID=1472 RepID=UPI00345A4C44
MPADLPQTQHDHPQRQYRSTRVRPDEQKIVQKRENAGQASSKQQPKDTERAAQTDPINAIRTLFLILCISLVGYALIREYHNTDTVLQPSQQMVSPDVPMTGTNGDRPPTYR